MDLSKRTELRHLARIVEALNEAAPEVEWLLVGAQARDLLLQYAHGIEIARATTDVDFAIAVENWNDFSAICKALLNSGYFKSAPGVDHKIVFEDGTKIDLVPFGGVENPDSSITWPTRDNPDMDVIGFTEAMRTAIQTSLPLGQRLSVVSLPMLLLLKLFTWQDRRDRRPGVDAADIMLILRSYTDCENLERMVDEHSELMEPADFDYELAGSILAGRDLCCLLFEKAGTPPRALELAREIIHRQLQDAKPNPLVSDVAADQMDHFRELLEAFAEGLNWKQY